MIPTTKSAAAIHAFHRARESYSPDIEVQTPRITEHEASLEVERDLWTSLVEGGAPGHLERRKVLA